MKKQFFAFIVAMTMTSAFAQYPTPELSVKQRLIAVDGEAVVYAVPNRILITFGVETFDANIRVAKTKNTSIIQKAVADLKTVGTGKQNINTDNMTVEPVWRTDHDHQQYKRNSLMGYVVNNNFTVIISNPDNVDAVITAALEAGITHIHGVDFQTTEFKALREAAREAAMKAAQEKARKMASAIGQSIGQAVNIQEAANRSHYFGSWSSFSRRTSRDFSMSQNVALNNASINGNEGMGNAEIDSVALGKIAIRASAHVTFELK
jgi:uncharacterized protein